MRSLRLRWEAWRLLRRLRREHARGNDVVAVETRLRAPDGRLAVASVRAVPRAETARMIAAIERFLRGGRADA